MGTECKIKLSGIKTVTELQRAIKDVKFAAGAPYVASSGLNNVVAFPPLANGEQVLIKGRAGDFAVYGAKSIEEGPRSSLFQVSGVVSATDDLTRCKGCSKVATSEAVHDVTSRIEALGL